MMKADYFNNVINRGTVDTLSSESVGYRGRRPGSTPNGRLRPVLVVGCKDFGSIQLTALVTVTCGGHRSACKRVHAQSDFS